MQICIGHRRSTINTVNIRIAEKQQLKTTEKEMGCGCEGYIARKVMEERIIQEAVQTFGTPLFLYNQNSIENRMQKLKGALLQNARLYYAMKANPLMGIVRMLNAAGCGIETASQGEIETAIKAGVNARDILFTSPGKTESELAYAIKAGVHIINVESLEEANCINDIAGNLGKVVDIALRINQNVNFSKAKIKMTGVSSQFGIEETELTEQFFDQLASMKNIRVMGIQVYSGTQVLVADEILKNVEYVIKMALSLSEKYGFQLSYLNLGGGFGIPYFKDEKELDLAALHDGMMLLEKQYGEKLNNTEIIFESGRFLVADSGLYVTRILHRKESKDNLFYICDGGSNFHSSTAFLGRFIRNNFPMYAITDRGANRKVNVVGPLCTPTDLMGQNVELSGNLQKDDLIIILKSGAYGLTYSPIHFLSHETPMEVMWDSGKYKILRERGKAEDLWIRQRITDE